MAKETMTNASKTSIDARANKKNHNAQIDKNHGKRGYRELTAAETSVAGEYFYYVFVIEGGDIDVTNTVGDSSTSLATTAGTGFPVTASSITCNTGSILAYIENK